MPARILRAAAEGIDLPLAAADNRTLILPNIGIALTLDGARLARITLEVSVPHDVYLDIERADLFHLEAEHRGSFHDKAFDSQREVELEIELASALVSRLAGEGAADPATAVGLFMGIAEAADPEEPILDAANWYAIHVKQERGGIKSGYATTWARADVLG